MIKKLIELSRTYSFADAKRDSKRAIEGYKSRRFHRNLKVACHCHHQTLRHIMLAGGAVVFIGLRTIAV